MLKQLESYIRFSRLPTPKGQRQRYIQCHNGEKVKYIVRRGFGFFREIALGRVKSLDIVDICPKSDTEIDV